MSYSGSVRTFAAARGAADPEAIANDVMLKVIRNLATFDGGESAFVGWMFKIARNRIIDEHRMANRRPSIVDGMEPPEMSAGSTAADVVALERIATNDMVELLQRLTADQCEVLALRMIADLSLKEVAKIVDKPVTAVKAAQRRGLRALQKEILLQAVSQP